MSPADDKDGHPAEGEALELSAAAERSRRRLHEEMERVRLGVEEMLAEQEHGTHELALRRELDSLREETRRYVKRRVGKTERRVGKTERRLRRSLGDAEARLGALEGRIEAVEQERRYAEWRIHMNTEAMLDGLLQEIRAIADLLTGSR